MENTYTGKKKIIKRTDTIGETEQDVVSSVNPGRLLSDSQQASKTKAQETKARPYKTFFLPLNVAYTAKPLIVDGDSIIILNKPQGVKVAFSVNDPEPVEYVEGADNPDWIVPIQSSVFRLPPFNKTWISFSGVPAGLTNLLQVIVGWSLDYDEVTDTLGFPGVSNGVVPVTPPPVVSVIDTDPASITYNQTLQYNNVTNNNLNPVGSPEFGPVYTHKETVNPVATAQAFLNVGGRPYVEITVRPITAGTVCNVYSFENPIYGAGYYRLIDTFVTVAGINRRAYLNAYRWAMVELVEVAPPNGTNLIEISASR